MITSSIVLLILGLLCVSNKKALSFVPGMIWTGIFAITYYYYTFGEEVVLTTGQIAIGVVVLLFIVVATSKSENMFKVINTLLCMMSLFLVESLYKGWDMLVPIISSVVNNEK